MDYPLSSLFVFLSQFTCDNYRYSQMLFFRFRFYFPLLTFSYCIIIKEIHDIVYFVLQPSMRGEIQLPSLFSLSLKRHLGNIFKIIDHSPIHSKPASWIILDRQTINQWNSSRIKWHMSVLQTGEKIRQISFVVKELLSDHPV